MQNNSKKKNILISALSVVLAATLLFGGGTYAYLQGTTEEVVNDFQTNKVLVDLAETTGGDYNIVPGTSEEKDPTVTVNATIPAYVYVTVTDTTEGLVTYTLADGWTLLDGTDNIYYREVEGSDAEQTFPVLKDNTVYYDAALQNSDMLDADGNLKDGIQLTFTASAMQKEPFNDAVKAYYQADTVVNTADDLKTAVSSADDGDVIALQGDIQLTSTLNVNSAVTFVGDENTLISGAPIATHADVTFDSVAFEKPSNANKNATIVYGYDGTQELIFENCTFSDPQWEVVQITSNDIKSLVVNNCTFNADNVDGATSGYGNTATQAIRYIHIQPSKNPEMNITITNNTFNHIENVKDSIVGIYFVASTSTLTVGGNTFSGWAAEDVTNGVTPKLSVGWPEVEALKTISVWEGSPVTYTIA